MDIMVGDGGFENMDAFRNSLPEELRNEEMIKNAKDVGSIAQMAVDNKRMVGQKTEEFLGSIPANGDSPEGATALDVAYTKLGWPGVEGKYEVTRPEAVDGGSGAQCLVTIPHSEGRRERREGSAERRVGCLESGVKIDDAREERARVFTS